MDPIIKKELEKVVYVNLPDLNSGETTFYIPKYIKPIFEVGQTYIIELPETIINNLTSALAINMNKNTAPNSKYIKAYISKLAGKYLYVDSISYDLEKEIDGNYIWSGYLLINELIQIRKI